MYGRTCLYPQHWGDHVWQCMSVSPALGGLCMAERAYIPSAGLEVGGSWNLADQPVYLKQRDSGFRSP